MDERTQLGGNYAAELQPPETYRARRQRLAETVGEGTVVVWGAGDDRGYGDVGTFRQDVTFFYLTGVELPNAVLVLRPQDDFEALLLPPRDEAIERWTGPKWGPGEEAAAALGFAEVLCTTPTEIVLQARRRPVPGLEGRLAGWLSEPGATLWTPLPAVPAHAELPPTHRLIAALRDRLPTFAVRDLSEHVARLRQVKDAGEVELMQKAIDATVEAQRRAARAIRPGTSEGAVDGAVYAAFRERGAEGIAFPSIVGSGYNGTTLHYDQNACECANGDLVVVDIGARYGYYCGDITRTYPVNGRFTERQRLVYDVVLAAHDRVAEAIRPGTTIFELRRIAYATIEEAGLSDDQGEPLGQYFIHGLGHFLGLEAHDCGDDEDELEPGMVITNEPGVYIQSESLGVRIENDFLVTEDGCANLCADLPTSADAIERLMRG
jgi:Xaa-Pro aminopeptidase